MKKITKLFLALALSTLWWGAKGQALSEGFESGTFPPAGWTENSVTGTVNWATNTGNNNGSIAGAHGGTLNSMLVDASGTADTSRLITPSMNLTTLPAYELRFWYSQVDWGGDQDELYVYYKTSAAGSWSILGSYTTSVSAWTEVILPLPATSNDYYIAFDGVAKYGRGVTLDDITVAAPPSCLAPSSLTTLAITSSSASLAWTENGSATSWEIEYDTTGFTQSSGNSIITSTNPHSLTGLTAATSYDFYVRAICGTGDTSIWAGPYSFKTLCNAYVAPYLQNFDNLALTAPYTALPNCWGTQTGPDFWDVTNDIVNNGHSYLPNIGDHTTGTGNYMWIDASGDITANEMVSPDIDISGLTTPYVGFWFASNNTTNTVNHTISLDAWDGTAWVNITTENGNFTGWVEVAGNIPGTIPSTTRFRIQAIADATGTSSTYYYNDLGIDDFFVMEAPSCLAPTNLASSVITSNSANLSWTDNAGATQWSIEYGAAGFAQGTGTTFLTAANPDNLTGLTSNTSYDFYVRAICGVGDTSAWSASSTFSTPCSAVVAPWLDDVEAHTPTLTFTTSNCWTAAGTAFDWNIDGAGSTPSAGTGPTAAKSGVNYFYVEASSGSVGDLAELTSPLIDVTALTTPTLEFNYHMFGSANGVMSDLFIDVFDGSTWVVVDSIKGEQQTAQADPWYKRSINLSAFSGTIQVKFRAYKNGAQWGDVSLDDIEVIEAPSCIQPGNLTATNLTATTAELGWSQIGSPVSWDVEYGTVGFTQGTGTTVNTAVNPINISGLSANTSYEFYVFARCSAADSSTWAGPYTFTTACPPVTGDSLADPILIGSFPYADTNSTASCYSDTRDNPSADVFYQMIVPACFDSVLVSLCGSSYDTYLRVLDASGTEIVFNDDACGAQSELTLTGVTSGDTLYVVVEGYGASNGNYMLNISGVSAGNVSVTGTVTDVSCNGLSDGGIDITVSGGTAPYTYVWSTGDITADLTGIGANSYNLVSVTDSNGCTTGGINYTVNEPTALTVSLTDNGNITATAAASGGTSPYTYSWSNGDTTSTTSVTNSGMQVVTVIDSNGCAITDSISIVISSLSNNSSNNVALNVYPNPNKGVFTINVNTTNVKELNIQVMNAQGQTVYSKNNFDNITNVNEEIDLSNNAKGFYFINITSDKGVKTHKVTVQ